jgi:hypothetical protein
MATVEVSAGAASVVVDEEGGTLEITATSTGASIVEVGTPGPSGATGPQGASVTGPPGPAGKDGADGDDGYTPIKGTDYFDGADGADGADGVDGKDGKAGATGPTGPMGPTGPAGSAANILTVPRVEVNDTDYTLLTTDYLVVWIALSQARTLNLPYALCISGRTFKVKDEAYLAGTYNVTLLPEAGHSSKINNQTSIKLELNGDGLTFHGDGDGNWHVEA